MPADSQYEFPSAQHKITGYPYRVWAFSIFTAPFLLTIWLVLNSDDGISMLSFFAFVPLFFLFFSFSAPALLIYILAYWTLASSRLTNIQIKLLLGATGAGTLYFETLVIDSLAGNFFFHPFIIFKLIVIPFSIFSIAFSLKLK